jgi:hypothetical protein
MPLMTCRGCGASHDDLLEVAHHHEGCPEIAGAVWFCSCEGQHCDEHCDGGFYFMPACESAETVTAICKDCLVSRGD